jgi:hypothetical protein
MFLANFFMVAGMYQKFHEQFFGRKFFSFSKSFPRKQVSTNNYPQKYFFTKAFPLKQLHTKYFHQIFFCLIFFYASKIFSWKTGFYKKTSFYHFLIKKKFMHTKSSPRKQVST